LGGLSAQMIDQVGGISFDDILYVDAFPAFLLVAPFTYDHSSV